MLVIRRRPGEALFIGDSVEVRVLEVGQGRVSLGIVAPEAVPILRREIRDQNLAAARAVSLENIRTLVTRLRSNGDT